MLVLEGEAYVFAAAAGTLTGLSWVKPEKGSSRLEAFKKALGRCLQAYVFIAAFLVVAAAAETAIIMLMLE